MGLRHDFFFTFTVFFAGHSFVRKWMLLSNPGDKGSEEEEAVSVGDAQYQ